MATKGLWGASLPLVTVCEGAQALWWPCLAVNGQAKLAPVAPTVPLAAPIRQPKLFLLFVPGNPGLPSYYLDYLSTIHSHPLLRGQVEILAVGHVGHAPWPSTFPSAGPQPTSLKAQIEHKVRIVDRIREMYPRSEDAQGGEVQLVLCGHSVGSYLLLEVLKQRLTRLDGLHMLFPTVAHIGSTPNAVRIRVRLLHLFEAPSTIL